METFTPPKALVENPNYQKQRDKSLSGLSNGIIDPPIIDLINAFNTRGHCFTLQSCYGHFLYNHRQSIENLESLQASDNITKVTYRIAYVAFCIENSIKGRHILKALKEITTIDPEYIQFGSADWFWERQVNSYVLQVEPERFMYEDNAILDYSEALKIEAIRTQFFQLLMSQLSKDP